MGSYGWRESTNSGTSLAIQWLGLWASTVGVAGSILVRVIRSHMPCGLARKIVFNAQEAEKLSLCRGQVAMVPYTWAISTWGRDAACCTLGVLLLFGEHIQFHKHTTYTSPRTDADDSGLGTLVTPKQKQKQAQPRAVKPWDNNPKVVVSWLHRAPPGLSRLQNHKEAACKTKPVVATVQSQLGNPPAVSDFTEGVGSPWESGLEAIQSGSIHPLYILPRSIQCDVVKII